MTVERPIRIEDYLDETGNSPFHRWFNGLNKEAAAKVVAALTRMENGNLCNVKSVGKGVHEYRVNFGPGYRVYFGWDGPTLVILLSGGTKARQQADSLKLKKGGNDTGRATEERLKPQPRGSLQEDRDMALTRDFKETVRARIDSDPGFKAQLFAEAIECLIKGDVETGKSVLRDYINGTIGFTNLGSLTGIPGKSLMRMFSEDGNPQARNLFEVTSCIQQHEGFHVKVEVEHPGQDHIDPEASYCADTHGGVGIVPSAQYVELEQSTDIEWKFLCLDEYNSVVILPTSIRCLLEHGDPVNLSNFEDSQVWIEGRAIKLQPGRVDEVVQSLFIGVQETGVSEYSGAVRWK